MKIFINLGLPRTSSTNLQKNFYPEIKEINYLGKISYERRREKGGLFYKLKNYVNFKSGNIVNDNYINDLKEEFIIFCKNSEKNILISEEAWMSPYQKNNFSGKYEIISQWNKLDRLNKLMKGLDIEIKYFLIYRNPVEAIPSFYTMFHHSITSIYGRKYGDFNFLLKKILKRDHKFNEIKLFFDVYNLPKIKEILSPNPVKIIDYKLIDENPKEFLNEISDFFNIKVNTLLVNNIRIRTRVSKMDGITYLIQDKPEIFFYIKKIIPEFLIKILKKKLFLFNLLKKFNKFKKLEIDENLLVKVLQEIKII